MATTWTNRSEQSATSWANKLEQGVDWIYDKIGMNYDQNTFSGEVVVYDGFSDFDATSWSNRSEQSATTWSNRSKV